MSDDLSDLKIMMDAATPRPDAARRAANLALAQSNFGNLHGAPDQVVPRSPFKQLWTRAMSVLARLSGKVALTTTAVIAGAFLLITPQLQDSIEMPQPAVTTLDFDGTVTAPRIDRGPMRRDDLTGGLLQNEPLVQPFGEVLRGPVREHALPQAIQPDSFRPDAAERIGPADDMLHAPFAAEQMTIAENGAKPLAARSDTASYPSIRAALQQGKLPPPEMVRIAEMLNYFAGVDAEGNLDDRSLQPIITTITTPWNTQTLLVHIVFPARSTKSDTAPLADRTATGTEMPVARNIDMRVTFDPDHIAAFRRVGDELPAPLQAGQMQAALLPIALDAGHGVSLLYEVALHDAQRRAHAAGNIQAVPLGQVTLRDMVSGQQQIARIELPPLNTELGNADASFAAAIAGFGKILRKDQDLGDWSYGDAIALATANRGADPSGERAEAIEVMRMAQSLSE